VVEGFSDRVSTPIVRPCSVLGPWDEACLTSFRFARRGWLVYPGVRYHEMGLLHVDDVVDGMLTAAREKAAINRTYFLTSDSPVTWDELGSTIASAMGVSARAVNLNLSLVNAVSEAGEWVGRATGTAPLLCRSR